MVDLNRECHESRRISILCVDDEKSILKSLSRVLRKLDVDLHFAQDATSAISLLEKHSVDILLTDMRMPVMSGSELLKKVVDTHPNTVRMMMTGYSDMDGTISAINEGKIEHFIQKPWDSAELLSVIKRASKTIKMEEENQHLQQALQQSHETLQDLNDELENKVNLRTRQIRNALKKLKQEQNSLQKVLFNLISVNPYCDGKLNKSIAHLSIGIARKLNLDEHLTHQIFLAGLLFDIGIMTIDQTLLEKPFLHLSYQQQKRFYQQIDRIPLILSPVSHLPDMEKILCQQFEGFSQNIGYPKKDSGHEIHIGARILNFARDFCCYREGKMMSVKLNNKQVFLEMKKSLGSKYDPVIYQLLRTNQDLLNVEKEQTGLLTKQLEPDMLLLKPLYAQNNIMLLSEGHEFTQSTIDKLTDYEQSQNVQLKIFVKQSQNASS